MIKLSVKRNGKNGERRGQMIIEYALMFAVIVAVIIYASMNVVKPAVNRFFNATGRVLDNATNAIESRF